MERKHPPNLKKAQNQNNTDPSNNCNKGDATNDPHNNFNKGDAPSNCNKGDNCNVHPSTYVLRVQSEYYDLVYIRGGAILRKIRNEVKSNTRRQFRIHFARKAHDIISPLLAPIDGQYFYYDNFIKAYDLVADDSKSNKIECLRMDKMNYTAFTTVYEKWFKRMNWQRLPKPRNISMDFFHPEYFIGCENRLEARTTPSFYYFIKVKLNLKSVTETNIYTIKEHREIFPANNVLQMKETIQY